MNILKKSFHLFSFMRSNVIVVGLYLLFQKKTLLLVQPSFWQVSWQGVAVMLLFGAFILRYNIQFNSWLKKVFATESTGKLAMSGQILQTSKPRWWLPLIIPPVVLFEELLFRVGLIGALSSQTGAGIAVIMSAMIFALAHDQHIRLDHVNVFLFFYGLFFGLAYVLSGWSFAVIFVLHMLLDYHAFGVNLLHQRDRIPAR